MSVKSRQARRPWFIKRRTSCPICGKDVREYLDSLGEGNVKPGTTAFKCPHCANEMSWMDFWHDHQQKYNRTADLRDEGIEGEESL